MGLVVARHRVIQTCNSKLLQIFSFRRCDLLGKSLFLLYPSEEEFERIGRIGLQRMRGTGYYNDERIMKRRSNELFWCRVRGQSLTPEDPFRPFGLELRGSVRHAADHRPDGARTTGGHVAG